MTNLFVSSCDKDRRNNINLIRFVAAAMVVYGHMAHFMGGQMPILFGQGSVFHRGEDLLLSQRIPHLHELFERPASASLSRKTCV